jgi:hypothetical protein
VWRRVLSLSAAAALLALAPFTSGTPGGAASKMAAEPNSPFTLARVDPCFLVPAPPGGTVWPIAPTGQVHGIRGSFNEPRGGSPHFGVDVEALVDRAPVHAIASGLVRLSKAHAHRVLVVVPGGQHRIEYWHVVPLPGEIGRASWRERV